MLGKRLRELRIKQGLEQMQLAERLETTRENISAYENMHSNPSLKMLGKIADYFNVTTDYMLCRNDSSLTDEEWKIRAIKAEEELQVAKAILLLINRDTERFLK